MVATKNRAGMVLVLLLALFGIAGCSPSGPRALVKGKELLDDGKTDAALAELKLATSLLPTNAVAWNYLGLACHRAGQWTNAADAYSRALRLNRNLTEVRYNLGCLWLDLNKPEAAVAEFTAFTLKRGSVIDGWLQLGAAQLRANAPIEAETSFREALRINAQSAEACNGMGLAKLQRKLPREAAEQFSAALKRQPGFRPALLNLATVSHQYLNDRPEALRRYREYLALQPKPADAAAVLAIVASLDQSAPTTPRLPTTTVAPSAAVATNRPAATPVRSEVQSTVTKSGSSNSTPPVAVRLASTSPPQPAEVVHLPAEPVIRAATTEAPGATRPAEVGKPTAKATPAPPTSSPAATAKTENRSLLTKLNPFKREAKPTVVTPVAEIQPDPAPPIAGGRYTYLSPATPAAGDRAAAQVALAQGQQAQRAGRLAEAIQSYRRATQLDGSYFEAYYCLGLAAFEARSFRVALAAWETALTLRSDSADGRYNFALTLKAAGFFQDAANELERLLALHPDEARGHLTLGNLYADQLQDLPQARRHYNRVLQLDPRNPQAQAIRYWLVAHPG